MLAHAMNYCMAWCRIFPLDALSKQLWFSKVLPKLPGCGDEIKTKKILVGLMFHMDSGIPVMGYDNPLKWCAILK